MAIDHPTGKDTGSKEDVSRSSRDARLSVVYPNIEKSHLSKTTFSAKLPN